MNTLKAIATQVWLWTLLLGLVGGSYLGYHVGLVSGYDRALDALETVTKNPQ